MSYTNLHNYKIDGYQRVSYCRTVAIGGSGGPISRYGEIINDGYSGDGIVISKNLILGCKPEKADDFRPFIFEPTWCVYIKAQDDVDMGCYVRRVTFRMSPRLPLRLHVADNSPFEITEVLSTDFPIELQVDYLDPTMSSTTYIYKPNDAFDGKYNVDLRMNFQGHERRDKMFFVNPSTAMQLTLTTPTPTPRQTKHLPTGKSREPEKAEKSVRKQTLNLFKTTDRTKTREQEANSFKNPTAPRPIFNVRRPSLTDMNEDKP